jgi:hypothetical protein
MTEGFGTDLAWALRCEIFHASFALVLSVLFLAAFFLISIISSQAWAGRRISRSAFWLCFALASISHLAADEWQLGF